MNKNRLMDALKLLQVLRDGDEWSAKHIAKTLEKDKSTINSMLYTLETCGCVTRDKSNNTWTYVRDNLGDAWMAAMTTPMTAKDLAKALEKDKSTVNRILYAAEKLGWTSKGNGNEWMLVLVNVETATKEVEDAV
jgi:DNA-binding IclR family transcriptional regulator